MIVHKSGVTEEEKLELVRRYQQNGDLDARERLVIQYARFVKAIASKFPKSYSGSFTRDDLCSAGYMGLLSAISSYDAARGMSLNSYIRSKVRWAMQDELRNLDFLSRGERQTIRERAMAELELLGLEESELESRANDAVQRREVRFESLDQIDPEKEGYAEEKISTQVDPFKTIEDRELIEILRRPLPHQMNEVIRMHYIDGLTLKQVGELLGISEPRASKINAAALGRLRRRYNQIA